MVEHNIQVRKYPSENLVIFTFTGDFVDSDSILSVVEPCLDQFKTIVLDMHQLNYINSSAFGSLFVLASKIDQSQTRFCVMNPSKKFKIVFDSLGASKFIHCISSLNEL